ncbi:FMN-binding negative transcriptional regulator [Urbifossiella limnaea]|uniref:Protease synthase and sporulation protein PAI 2 n=1 Tax=Urbifossiella limnaea TaxID=2528023 RepID=A0A517XRG4_9BACT|nr:FMN-binding negative transcriptional regulator [Urbifossiella limnaea]QDU20106.1 Protease synthase and sporulation protein PAI 2 [Urbifossiella limnaea]
MYVPPHFAETDQDKLHDFINSHSFGLLVSQLGGVPFATHLPFLLDRAAGPCGTLVGHVARGNPHWQDLGGAAALAVFSGPHAYVSPTWYEAEPAVPTWNYLAVHATGRTELIDARDELRDIVRRSVAVYESGMPRPWQFDADSAYVDRLLAGIVGFRLRIGRLEGKWKLNQNHPAERRAKVIRALEAAGGENGLAVAAAMRQMLSAEDQP